MPHRLGKIITVLSCLDALLGNHLDLCASAALGLVSPGFSTNQRRLGLPVLEPDLYGPFGHVDLLGYAFSGSGSRRRVFIKLNLQGD